MPLNVRLCITCFQSHRRILHPTLICLFFCWVCLSGTVGTAAQPNFLIIMADDLCWRDLGYEGNGDVKTPHLDKLRTESMHLKAMFTPASMCSPCRHTLYTGLNPVRSGAYPNHTRVYEGTKSIFTHLKEAGYRVALQNKGHIGPQASFPYEYIQGVDLAQTTQFVGRKPDQPWLLVFASNDPHGPYTRGPTYDADAISVPRYLHDNPMTRSILAKYYGEITQLDQQVGALLKMVEESGQEDHTVVIFLSEQGSGLPYGGKWSLYDNGIRVSGLVRWPGKIAAGSQTEALMQYADVAPTLLEAAGINPETIDPNCPDAFGNRGFDGTSFLKVLLGEQEELHSYVFAEHTTVGINGYLEPYPMRAVRDKRFKFIRNLASSNTYSIGGIHKGEPFTSWKKDAANDPMLAQRVTWLSHRPEEELYDLQSDPLETHNLAKDPAFAEIKSRLSAELKGWMQQQGDHGLATEELATTRQNEKRQAKKRPGNRDPQKKDRRSADAKPS